MTDESQILQRDQMKKPSLQRHLNGNLSSPFPFTELGLNAASNLNNILRTFPRENEFVKKTTLARLENHSPEDSINDPYLKPLNLERLKSVINNNEQSAIPNFIRSSNINNDFSTNVFLRYQSGRSDISNKEVKTIKTFQSNSNNKGISKSNGIMLPNRDQRPNTAALPLKMRGFSSSDDLEQRSHNGLESGFGRPKTASVQLKPLNGSFMPVVGTQTGTKFYLKSFKTDALIYNSHEVIFPQESLKEVPAEKVAENAKEKNLTSQSLYLQVKNEVAEYRKQRLKEVSLDIENVPKLKLVSIDDIIPVRAQLNGLDREGKQFQESNNERKNTEILDGISGTKKLDHNQRSEECEVDDNSFDNKTLRRSKSVTFSEIVETREINDEVQSDIERNSSSEDSGSSSSDENESQGSVVSTDSDSDSEDSKSSLTNPSNQPKLQTPLSSVSPIKNAVANDKSENKENGFAKDDESDSDDEDNCNHKDESHMSVTKKTAASQDSDILKPSLSPDIRSQSPSTSSNSTSQSFTQNRPLSANTRARSVPERPTKKGDVRTKSKTVTCQQDLLDMTVFKETELNLPLIFSKFSFVPPVVNFVGEGEKVEQLPWQLRKLLRWRTSLLTPVIVKQIITRSGFRPSRLTTATDDLDTVETGDWILYFGKHMKGPVFKTLKEYQKVNHFPGSFQLGRKDRLWRNICKMQQQIGKKEFDFIPQTFCLPTDLELFKQCWETGGNKHKWIIKPPASARGIGIKVVYKWNQIPKRRPVVVQRYIANPYLINDSKFDLRLYVFLASIDPLRIYLYDDGLVRFASIKYTNSVKSINNRFIHLTNYSVNRLNIEYLDNNDNEACKGHKWSLKALWNYLRKRGVNTEVVWERIKDLVVKTVISAEEMIGASVKSYCSSPYNVKELFGFDVLLDENLKPWILEVNVSPSLHSDTPLDVAVKSGMIKDVLNLSGYMLPELNDIDPPPNISSSKPPTEKVNPSSDLNIDLRLWLYKPSDDEVAKAKHFIYLTSNGHPGQRFDLNDTLPYQILDCLTPNDVRCLVDSYDEYDRRGHFQRVYPVSSTNLVKKYLACFESIRYFNVLLATFITKYSRNGQDVKLLEKLCQKKLHLLSSERGDKIDPKHIWHQTNFSGDV